jgi:hypothetical protein
MPRELTFNAVHEPASGGYGVPRGPNVALGAGVTLGKTNRYQVRFHAGHPWQGALPCEKPERWRWGKRWKSHDQHWRGVDVARDLARVGQAPKLLESVLLDPVPEIRFEPRARPLPRSPAKPAPALETSETSGCSLGSSRRAVSDAFWLLCAGILGRWRRSSVRVQARAKSRR